ncbi:tonB-dependent receptor [Prevotella sp. CAG:1058]|nr:tonB-dependent receptor [Prevotella sp. CAG:1058]
MKRVRKLFGTAALLSLVTVQAFGADIADVDLKGRVKDSQSKEPLIGATVKVIGSDVASVTDIDGNFQLSGLKDGIYDIEIKYIGYKTAVKRQVKIEDNKVTTLDFEMETDNRVLAGVEVVAKANRESENVTMMEQKRSVIAVQTIGAQELSRKGISDAQAAVAKISGISKQEGVKNVFVRGLGDRYNFTTLNRFPLPSEDPEYKNIALDFFSTDIIQSIDVNKAFYSNTPADVAGADINITSKELTGDGKINVSLSGGFNTKTLSSDFMRLDGVDMFGFADKTQPGGNLNTYNFKNSLDPSKQNLQINQSYTISGGKKFLLGENRNPLKLYLVAGHNKNYTHYEEEVRNSITTGELSQDMEGDISQVETSQIAMANLEYTHNKKHSLAYNFMMVHATKESVGDYLGMDADYQSSDTYEGFMRRQQTNDNLLFVNQLISKWTLGKNIGLNAGLSYNTINGNEPDRRINNLVKTDSGYVPMKGTGIQQRYFSELDEKDLNARASLVYKLNDGFENNSNVQIGYMGRFVDDDFEAVEYDMSVVRQTVFDINHISFDDYYNQDNYAGGMFQLDRNIDKYGVRKNIHSAYAEATYQFTPKFIANLGLKYDDVDMKVNYNVNRGGSRGEQEIDKSYFLPSLNLRYNINDKHALRLAASKTYTLPQAKEISPFRYVSVSFNSQGNPNLKPSDNYNIDLKWDWYISPSEIFSITGFYKYIKNPISRIEIASAGGFLSYENISDHATAAGVEMEMKKHIFSRSLENNGMSRLTLGVNGAYTYTCAKVPLATDPSGSQLEGAAPWIVNADLTYLFRKGGNSFTGALVFNYFSDRIYTIGTEGYQDIMENGIPTLDFVASAQIGKHFTINLKARNLLDAAHQLTRKGNATNSEVVLSKYKKGTDFSIGLSYNL